MNLVCNQFHPLVYSKRTSARCDRNCGRSGLLTTYSCKTCNYDVCDNCCYTYYNINQPRCRNQHILAMTARNNARCDKNCGANFLTSTYACEVCDYDLCSNCWSATNSPSATCMMGHKLVFTQGNLRSFPKCDSCFFEGLQSSWACSICNYDLCEKCAKNNTVRIMDGGIGGFNQGIGGIGMMGGIGLTNNLLNNVNSMISSQIGQVNQNLNQNYQYNSNSNNTYDPNLGKINQTTFQMNSQSNSFPMSSQTTFTNTTQTNNNQFQQSQNINYNNNQSGNQGYNSNNSQNQGFTNQNLNKQNQGFNYQNQGFTNQNQGFINQNQGFSNQNLGGFSNQTQGYNNQNQGFSNQNQGFSNQNQGFSNQNQGLSNQNQGYNNQNQGFNYQNQGYNNQNQGFNNQNFNNMSGFTNQTNSYQMGYQTSSYNVSSDSDVNTLISNIKKATFSSDMVNALKLGVNSRYFTATQAYRIVKTFTFDGDQKQACLILYEHLSDKNNVSEMLNACTFSSTKTDVMKTLRLI